ncbi:MAG TPA: hypothetical protein VEC15_10740 [Actinomycetota bacterium]|jgi:hypothetical protein|nr:hypothetical protein [Actinomycetota bacterium]
MTTSQIVRERALALASAGASSAVAIEDLETCCGGRRVAVVRARQELSSSDEGTPTEIERAVEFLDAVLQRLPA